jgi:hypothetical protein
MALAEAVNVPVAAPALTVTEAGAVRTEFEFEMVITVPPAGAALESVTVQVVGVLGPMLAGLQESEDTPMAAIRLTAAVATAPFRSTLMVAG